MDDSGKYIVWVVPIFFLLIFLEMFVALRKKGRAIRMNDSVTNLQIGLSEQVLSVVIRGSMFVLYAYIYENFRFFTLEFNILNTIILLFLFDMLYYWAHRWSHEINIMWASHIVHHSSQEYNLSVALRQPWFQPLTTSWVFLPVAFLGFPTEMFIMVSAVDILYQFWIHTEYVGKMGKVIEFIFNTPSHHRVHHGTNPKYLDKNHAGIFIIWDRIFGTFQEEEEAPEYGITSGLESYNPLYINTHYFGELWQGSAALKRPLDKFKLWFMPPGWRPASEGGRYIPTEAPNLPLYNIPISKSLALYLGFQFLFAAMASLWVIWYQSEYSVWEILSYAVIAIIQMSLLGLVFEQRKSSKWLDLIRLFTLPLMYYFMKGLSIELWGVFGVLWVISIGFSIYYHFLSVHKS